MGNIIQALVFSTILFYSSGQPYDVFSNTTHIPVTLELNGQMFSAGSTEAVFQGLKGLGIPNRDANARNLIVDTRTPLSSLRTKAENLGFNALGKNEIYNQSLNGGAAGIITVKEEVMYQLLLAKASQHPRIAKALLETGSVDIVENTFINKKYNDEFWGNGHSRKGRNALGKAWMRVRSTFNKELQNGGIRQRFGLSDDLAHRLGLRSHRRGSQYGNTTITLRQLQRIKSASTVAELNHNQNNKNNQNNKRIARNHYHKKHEAFDRVKKATQAMTVSLVDDINIPNKKVLKILFKDKRMARRFATFSGNAPLQGRTVFLGERRAQIIFKKLNIDTHGRRNPRTMWKALIYESASH